MVEQIRTIRDPQPLRPVKSFRDAERVFESVIDSLREIVRTSNNEFISTSRKLGEQMSEKAAWKGVWADGDYLKHDMVRDGLWLMIANKDTDDRPAPQPTGASEYIHVAAPSWSAQDNVSVVETAARFTVTQGGIITDIRVWLPNVTASTLYRVDLINVTTGVSQRGTTFLGTELAVAGWISAPVEAPLILPGAVIEIRLIALESSGTTNFTYEWHYTGALGGEADPGTGNCNRRQSSRIRVNDLDDGGTDRTSDLGTVTIGTTIRIEQFDDVNKWTEYIVNAIDDNGTYFTYFVDGIDDQGSSGEADAGKNADVTFTNPTPAATDYVELVDFWLTNVPTWASAVSGILNTSGSDVSGDDAYGVDLSFQPHDISPDWDLMAATSGVIS